MRPGKHNTSISDPALGDTLPSGVRLRAPRVGLRGGRNRSYTVAERLWARTDKTSSPHGCWIVSGATSGPSGHVPISRTSEGLPVIRAHRLAWELLRGPITPGLNVLHNCPGGDNPRCVNPEHLWLGTQRENIHDSIHKGRYNAFGIQKLNAAQVRQIRALAALGRLQKDIAAKFGIARNTVSGIVLRKSWDHLDRPLENTVANVVLERVPSVQLPILGEVA